MTFCEVGLGVVGVVIWFGFGLVWLAGLLVVFLIGLWLQVLLVCLGDCL